jgi:hypothetical protein
LEKRHKRCRRPLKDPLSTSQGYFYLQGLCIPIDCILPLWQVSQ